MKAKFLLKEKFANQDYVTLSFDFWSSCNMDAYLGVVYFYVDNEFEIQSGLLEIKYFPGKKKSLLFIHYSFLFFISFFLNK